MDSKNATQQASLYARLMSLADPRADDLFLMQSPVPVTVICAVYIYYVLKAGPKWMKDREPYSLRRILIAYNGLQTAFSSWLFYEGLQFWVQNFGWDCVPLDQSDRSPNTMWSIKLAHCYFLSKISELADTIFFVLKKKQHHISLLHVFHHAGMLFSVWCGLKFFPGGNLAFFGLANVFVHIWMYLYYMLAAMGQKYKKFVWWKRHITQLQIVQFVTIMVYMIYISNKCNVSGFFLSWIIIMDIIFIYLFVEFYKKAYHKGGDLTKESKTLKVQ